MPIIFSSKNSIINRILNEEDIVDVPVGGKDDETNANRNEDLDNFKLDTPNQDNNTQDDSSPQPIDNQGNNVDKTDDGNDDLGGFDFGDEEENPDDNQNQDNEESQDNNQDNSFEDTSQSDDSNNSKLKQAEETLFNMMSPEEKNIKDMELRQNYIDLFKSINELADNIKDVEETAYNIEIVKYVVDKLLELKRITSFYIENVYGIKTYFENLSNYFNTIATMRYINDLIDLIKPKNLEKDKENEE